MRSPVSAILQDIGETVRVHDLGSSHNSDVDAGFRCEVPAVVECVQLAREECVDHLQERRLRQDGAYLLGRRSRSVFAVHAADDALGPHLGCGRHGDLERPHEVAEATS